MNSVVRASCSFSCFLVKTTEIIHVENFQGVSRVSDKYEVKTCTVESICDPKIRRHLVNGPKQQSSTQNGTAAGPSEKCMIYLWIIVEIFLGRGGIFLGE